MKHLKRFNESVSDDIINDCKDILQPIIDSGISILVYAKYATHGRVGNGRNQDIVIAFGEYATQMRVNQPSFSLEDYIDELEHLNSYLEEKGYRYSQPYYGSFANRISDLKLGRKLQLMDLTYIPKEQSKVDYSNPNYIKESVGDIERQEISNDIKDILLPIEDLGLEVRHQIQHDYIIVYIVTKMSNRVSYFSFGDIRDEVNHLVDKMESKYPLDRSRYLRSARVVNTHTGDVDKPFYKFVDPINKKQTKIPFWETMWERSSSQIVGDIFPDENMDDIRSFELRFKL